LLHVAGTVGSLGDAATLMTANRVGSVRTFVTAWSESSSEQGDPAPRGSAIGGAQQI